MIDLPPWLQTTLTVLGVLAVMLPPLGRVLAMRWPDLGARLEALGSDLSTALGRTPPAGMPRGVSPAASLPSERAENAATVVRAEIKRAAQGAPPSPPKGPIVMMCLALAAGCTRAEQVQAANAQRTVGHGTARTLGELCDYEAADAMPADDARVHAFDLDQRGCDVAWQAQTAFARAHAAQVAAIEAAERGECMIGTPKERPACDLIGVASKTYAAGRALADSVAAVRAAAESMGAK